MKIYSYIQLILDDILCLRNGKLHCTHQLMKILKHTCTVDLNLMYYIQINVKCTDHGEPPLSSTSPDIDIQVLDVNDNPPEFLTNITKVNIKENQTEIIVTEVSAVDRDSMAVIQYSIKGNFK